MGGERNLRATHQRGEGIGKYLGTNFKTKGTEEMQLTLLKKTFNGGKGEKKKSEQHEETCSQKPHKRTTKGRAGKGGRSTKEGEG